MKKMIGLLLLVFVGAAGWRIGGSLSSDALSMAVGVLFGVIAGVPTALLLLSVERRRGATAETPPAAWARERGQLAGYPPGGPYPAYPQQPPVIVLAGGTPTPMAQPGYPTPGQPESRDFSPAQPWPQERRARHFKVVGEKEAWVDEW